MSTGYVLDFSNRTFSNFFLDSVKINIDDDKYQSSGSSKANRLRSFWDQEPDLIVGKALKDLLAIWLHTSKDVKADENKNYKAAEKAINRILGIREVKKEITEQDFLEKDFGSISIQKLKIEATLIPVIEQRLRKSQTIPRMDASIFYRCSS